MRRDRVVGTALADPLSALGNARRSFVIPDLRVLYISLSKNACTSIRWLLAELSGEDLDGFPVGLKPWTTAEEGVHNRALWKRTPTLGQIDPELRSTIHPDNGWFVFAVVRDPRPRLFSAWQNKFLLRGPDFASYRTEPWYPRIPESADDIIEDFTTFVDMLERSPRSDIAKNSHFAPQVNWLALDSVPYSKIYDIREMSVLRADLDEHVKALGHSGAPAFRKANSTPLRANAGVFAGDMRSRIERIYAADFERFGERWDFDRIDKGTGWSSEALAQVDVVIAMSERIRELRTLAQRANRRAERSQERARELEARFDGVRTSYWARLRGLLRPHG